MIKYTIKQFNEQYPDEDACLDSIFRNRYGSRKACPNCGVVDAKFYKLKGRKAYSCRHCRYQIHPLAGTIFHKSETPLRSWFFAIYLFGTSKNGVSAKELERHLGVTYKTAWRIAKQVRLLMQQDDNMLSGIAEADETFIGGKYPKYKGNKDDNKTPVLGIVEKGGSARAKVTDWASTNRAMTFVRANLEIGAELHTDESRIYLWSKEDYNHRSVNHYKKEYVRDNVHTNTIEGLWGQLKRSIDGTYHVVSPKYLQSYVNEFVYRYNLRDVAVAPVLIQQAAKRV